MSFIDVTEAETSCGEISCMKIVDNFYAISWQSIASSVCEFPQGSIDSERPDWSSVCFMIHSLFIR